MPDRLVVWLEDNPLQAAIEAFLKEERGAARRDVFEFVWGYGPTMPGPVSPRTTWPNAGNSGRHFMPDEFSRPFLGQTGLFAVPRIPIDDASIPAGAFHTPSFESVRAVAPVITPEGTKVSIGQLEFRSLCLIWHRPRNPDIHLFC